MEMKVLSLVLIAILAISSVSCINTTDAREITIRSLDNNDNQDNLIWFQSNQYVPYIVELHTDTWKNRYNEYMFSSNITARITNLRYNATYNGHTIIKELKFDGNESLEFYRDHLDSVTLPYYGVCFKYWFYNHDNSGYNLPQYRFVGNDTIECWTINFT
jgi:hypothetical protein